MKRSEFFTACLLPLSTKLGLGSGKQVSGKEWCCYKLKHLYDTINGLPVNVKFPYNGTPREQDVIYQRAHVDSRADGSGIFGVMFYHGKDIPGADLNYGVEYPGIENNLRSFAFGYTTCPYCGKAPSGPYEASFKYDMDKLSGSRRKE